MHRRSMLFVSIAVMIFVLAASAVAAAYNEAPMLAEKVAAGELPPVEERLPKNPLVIEPIDSIGQYGGTWYRQGFSQDWAHIRMAMYGFSPVRWVEDGLGIEPNWVESWESNEDATVWTLKIREGIKWSDGAPMTSADFMFWWEDMVLNEEMSDQVPDMFAAAGQPAKITAPDDYTLVIEYAAPSPLLPERMAMWPNGGIGERMIVPAHYLKQFHPDYTDEYEDFEILEEKMEWWFNVECPVLTEWMPVEHRIASRLVLERNPYYYAVDPEGNQLPYIDRIQIDLNEDLEVIKLKLLNGESDFQVRPYLDMTDLNMLIDGQEAGGYKITLWDSGSGTGPMFYTNWNHPDPEKAEVYRTTQFRQALSHALNRARMQNMLFFGLGTLTTGTFSPKAIEFHRTPEGKALYAEWRDSYVAYDPDKAKALLDEIGVVDQDGDGWRDLPSGAELTLRIDYDAETDPVYIQVNEMAKADWEAVGLKTNLNPMDGSALALLDQTATFDIHDSWEVGDGPNHLVFPQWVVPIDLSRWAPLYGSWYQQLQAGTAHREADLAPRDRTPPREEPAPNDPVKRLQDLYDKARVEPDEAKRDKLVHEMIRIHIDEGPFFLGTVCDAPRVVVYNEKLQNVPEGEDLPLGGFVNPWIMVYPAIVNPSTFWFAE